jgi:hypothetical protein
MTREEIQNKLEGINQVLAYFNRELEKGELVNTAREYFLERGQQLITQKEELQMMLNEYNTDYLQLQRVFAICGWNSRQGDLYGGTAAVVVATSYAEAVGQLITALQDRGYEPDVEHIRVDEIFPEHISVHILQDGEM